MYNKVKNYIYKTEESAYKRIISNIHLLLNADVSVSIRMNCDAHNAENLKQLVKDLHEEFKEYKNFSMYVWPIFEEGFTRTDEQKQILYKSLLEIETLIQNLGYKLSHGINFEIKGIHCMVDSGDGVIISPNGDLGVCEHYIDRDFFSHIDTPLEKDMDILKSWRDYTEYTKLCNNCPLYPSCLRMKKCPDESICDDYQKEYMIKHNIMCLEDLYREHINSCNTNCECKKTTNNLDCHEYNAEIQK